MWQIPLTISIVLGGAVYYLHNQNENLNKEIAHNEIILQEQKIAFDNLKAQSELQAKQINQVQERNIAIQNEMSRYLDIFKRHNLSKLAAAKPGLIENRANDATKEIFDTIENDSRSIDGLNSELQFNSEEGSN